MMEPHLAILKAAGRVKEAAAKEGTLCEETLAIYNKEDVMPERYFIIGSYQRFLDWCEENRRDSHDRDVILVNSEKHAREWRLTVNDTIVIVGGLESNDYEIVSILRCP